jgi:hypothetical protein
MDNLKIMAGHIASRTNNPTSFALSNLLRTYMLVRFPTSPRHHACSSMPWVSLIPPLLIITFSSLI